MAILPLVACAHARVQQVEAFGARASCDAGLIKGELSVDERRPRVVRGVPHGGEGSGFSKNALKGFHVVGDYLGNGGPGSTVKLTFQAS